MLKFLLSLVLILPMIGQDITNLLIDEWIQVCSLYEGCCNKPMPQITLVEKLPCNLRGVYSIGQHKIKLSLKAPERTVYHEFHHACGNMLGEISLPNKCLGDMPWYQ